MSRLSQYFEGVIVKRLSAVEIDKTKSNQHEFNGVKSMLKLFGSEKVQIETDFIYLGEDEEETLISRDTLTWYDARKNHPSRTEYRLYYPNDNEVIQLALEGDLLMIAKKPDGTAFLSIIRRGSTYERQMLWLFDIVGEGEKFQVKELDGEEDREIGYVESKILEILGWEPEQEDSWLDTIIGRFGGKFPTTRLFSAFARETAEDVDLINDPDFTLIKWINHEEILFRTLERYLVQEQLDKGFEDVDAFIKFSLSVQNRRKSRMGYALENHLTYIFENHDLSFSRQAITEQNSKPDYLFPSIREYHNERFPSSLLTMLGVKSTCKERWNQVLAEANRIELKHLLTLEPGISERQTLKMQEKLLQLVLPQSIHETYTLNQKSWLLNLSDFIELVKVRESLIQ